MGYIVRAHTSQCEGHLRGMSRLPDDAPRLRSTFFFLLVYLLVVYIYVIEDVYLNFFYPLHPLQKRKNQGA